jgi:hypothetical protein
MSGTAAATIAVHGIGGVFIIIAALLFLVAAILAATEGRLLRFWPVLVAAGLLLWVLTGIVK